MIVSTCRSVRLCPSASSPYSSKKSAIGLLGSPAKNGVLVARDIAAGPITECVAVGMRGVGRGMVSGRMEVGAQDNKSERKRGIVGARIGCFEEGRGWIGAGWCVGV